MMKTKLFTLVFAVLALGACKKEIKLDVKQIHLTDKTGMGHQNRPSCFLDYRC